MNVTIRNPHLPDGYEISLTGLNAVLKNNESVEVDDEAVVQYEAATGKKLEDVLKGKQFGGPGRPKPVEETAPPVGTVTKLAPPATTTNADTGEGNDQ